MVKRGTPAFFSFFAQLQKRCHETPKMVKSDTGPLFSFFWAHSKAVSRFIKNDEEGHRASFLPFLLNFKSGVTTPKMAKTGP